MIISHIFKLLFVFSAGLIFASKVVPQFKEWSDGLKTTKASGYSDNQFLKVCLWSWLVVVLILAGLFLNINPAITFGLQ